ncbi:energy transducer TonB [Sphingosinicellaceae bacterium]|nr:energy transducer TonB [Sphingosinicellaceae bacterium]
MISQWDPSRLAVLFLSVSAHLALGYALLTAIERSQPIVSHPAAAGSLKVFALLPIVEQTPGETAAAAALDPVVEKTQSRERLQVASAAPLQTATSDHSAPGTIGDRGTIVTAVTPTVREIADIPSAETAAFRLLLQAHLAHYRIYPVAAQHAGDQGVVVLHFVLDREGRVTEPWIESSSGAVAIDREALDAVARAQPLPRLPVDWPARIDISLPVAFNLG